MTKRLLGLMLAIIVTFSLWGCENKTQKEPEGKTEKKTELEVYAAQGEKENLSLLVQAYENLNPDVLIKINLFPESEYTQQMMRIKDQKIAADCIFFPNAGEAAIWNKKKILKDIQKWYAGTKEAEYYQEWYRNMETDGEYYMMPYRMGKMCVYYNKTLFDSLKVEYPKEGWTWEDYKETAKQLTGWADNKRIYGTLGFAVSSSWWMLPAWTRGASDPFNKEDLQIYRESAEWCRMFTSEFTEAFPYFDWTGNDWSRYDRVFLEGRLGMYFGEDSEANVLNREIKEQKTSITYDVAELPVWNEAKSVNIYNTAVIGMAEATEHPEETYQFMNFCSGESGAEILAKNSTTPVWQSPHIQETYLSHTEIPSHREYFLRDELPAETAVGVLYNAGVEVMENEVSLYMLGEQELDYTFENIEKKLENLKKE